MPEEDLPFEIDVEELKAWLDDGRDLALVDVREPHEYQICRLEGSRLMPPRELVSRWQELDAETPTVFYCHTGVRSTQAVTFLRHQGFARAVNLRGGIEAWSLRIDPTVPRY